MRKSGSSREDTCQHVDSSHSLLLERGQLTQEALKMANIMIACCGGTEVKSKLPIPELYTSPTLTSSTIPSWFLPYVWGFHFEMRFLHFLAHCIILAQTHFSRFLKNLSSLTHIVITMTSQIPWIQPVTHTRATESHDGPPKIGQRRKFESALLTGVNYFTDNNKVN